MRQIRMSVLALIGVAALVFSAVIAQQQAVEVLDDLAQQWQARFNEGNSEGVAELYTEDAILYTADGRVHQGRDEIQAVFQDFMESGLTGVSIEPSEAEGASNGTAYGTGYHAFRNAEGETVIEGNHMVIFTRENGEWRLHRHIANVVMPEADMND